MSFYLIGANQRVISSPERAIFFHPLAKDLSFSRYYSYVASSICLNISEQFLAESNGEHYGFLQLDFLRVETYPLCFSCRYWNYLQKQTIVLETYNTTYNYWMNRGLFFLHCWASWSFVFPYLTSCVHLLVAMRMLMGASAELYSSWTTGDFCELSEIANYTCVSGSNIQTNLGSMTTISFSIRWKWTQV